jgi:ribosomal protein S18 acetylase RimI-like enzyme
MKNKDFDANVKAKFCYLPSQIPHMQVLRKNNMLIIDGGLDSDMFNIICCDGAAVRGSIASAINHFKLKHLPCAFWVGFEEDPPGLEKGLDALGLRAVEDEWAMACDLKNTPPALIDVDCSIKKLARQAEVLDIIAVMNGILPENQHRAIESFYVDAQNFLSDPQSRLSFFICYCGGKPVAISSAFCHNSLVSVFDVIVVPEMRGKGLGKAMTLQAMRYGQEQGYETAVLTATNDARYFYEKIGFHVFKTMKVFS